MSCFKTKTILTVLCCFAVAGFAATGCGKKTADQAAGSKAAAANTQKTPAAQAGVPQAAAVPEATPTVQQKPITEEKTYFGFEDELRGWEIPAWAQSKSDYVGKSVEISQDFAKEGKSSMKVTADFTGGRWTAALVEIEQYLDLSKYRVISFDVYVPESAPMGLKANLIMTVGDNWKFVEMNQMIPLIPGQWVTITANIEPGSYDWKRVVPDENFAKDVRKLAIRVVSNNKPVYAGPIYIDNVRVGR
ncbi:MAG: hypothetical protein HQL28_03960 [Candidatus Omnitrophica bacterium]|nr:hypothetical protein [Candidatus Omnitrophota bacterium]